MKKDIDFMIISRESNMQEKEREISQSRKILLSLPMDIERRYREEAKRREINISEMLIKIIEERDYFERKLVEKDRIIENSTEKIHKSIVESLAEIKKTNLELEIVSSSLSSIPKVTEEARKINERCTKSSEVIGNFNVVLSKLTDSITETRNKMNGYHTILSSNKTTVEEINEYLSSVNNNYLNSMKNIKSDLLEKKSRIIDEFNSEMRVKMDKSIDYEIKRIESFTNEFLYKRSFLFYVFIVFLVVIAGLFFYGSYTNTSTNSEKIKAFDSHKLSFCLNNNGSDYAEICK